MESDFSILNSEQFDSIGSSNDQNIMASSIFDSTGKLKPEADVASLVILNRGFRKDKKAVGYYNTQKIHDADPADIL